MSTMYMSTPYGVQTSSPYGYNHHTPQPPPSPPADDSSRCSLPSISNLLDLADGTMVQDEQDQSVKGQQQAVPLSHSQQPQQSYPLASSHSQASYPQASSYARASAQSQQLQQQQGYPQQSAAKVEAHLPQHLPSSSRPHLPPTPPLQPDAIFDGRQSPSTSSTSSYSVVSAPSTFYTPSVAIAGVDFLADQRQRQAMMARKSSMPPRGLSSYATPYPTSNITMPSTTTAAYFTPATMPSPAACSQISSLYYQRPLPQFTPSLLPLTIPYTSPLSASTSASASGTSTTNPWQHHHYISPSSATSYSDSADRYSCDICHKGFSRPSSLKIHQHSHTGAKPFRCSYRGCGKTFSVRSNMKRHERGCHAYVLP